MDEVQGVNLSNWGDCGSICRACDLHRVFKIYLCIFNQVTAILQRHSIWVISTISRSKTGCHTGRGLTMCLGVPYTCEIWLLDELLETTNY